MSRGTFVSRDWLGPVLAASVTLLGLLGGPGEAAALVLLALATCFGWGALGRALLAGRRLPEPRRATLLRYACVAQALSVLSFCVVLSSLGRLWPAAAVAVLGLGLSAFGWPWRWRLAQASADRDRPHDGQLAQQHLVAAGTLLVLSLGSAIALSGVAWAMLMALVVSSAVDAWDEWRRPRPGDRVPRTALAARSSRSARPAVSHLPGTLQVRPTVRAGRSERTPDRPGRAHGGSRRADSRTTGRRVAPRR